MYVSLVWNRFYLGILQCIQRLVDAGARNSDPNPRSNNTDVMSVWLLIICKQGRFKTDGCSRWGDLGTVVGVAVQETRTGWVRALGIDFISFPVVG